MGREKHREGKGNTRGVTIIGTEGSKEGKQRREREDNESKEEDEGEGTRDGETDAIEKTHVKPRQPPGGLTATPQCARLGYPRY